MADRIDKRIATRNGKPAWMDAPERKIVPPFVPVPRKGFWAHLVMAWRGEGVMAAPTLPQCYQGVASAIPEGLVWSYRATIRGGRLEHVWTLVGPRGGIHVSAWWRESDFTESRWLGGIEQHSPKRGDYDQEAPDHEHCWVIGKPCWHDGSSLQFSEQIAPFLPWSDTDMGAQEHTLVLSRMLTRYHDWLPATPTTRSAAA